MTTVELFSIPQCKRYTASRWSWAYVFYIGCSFLLLIVPLLLCYSPKYLVDDGGTSSIGGIWKKSDVYHEQPRVRFKYQIIIVAQATASRKNSNEKENSTNSNRQTFPIELFY